MLAPHQNESRSASLHTSNDTSDDTLLPKRIKICQPSPVHTSPPQNKSKKSANPHPYTWSKNPYSSSYLGKNHKFPTLPMNPLSFPSLNSLNSTFFATSHRIQSKNSELNLHHHQQLPMPKHILYIPLQWMPNVPQHLQIKQIHQVQRLMLYR